MSNDNGNPCCGIPIPDYLLEGGSLGHERVWEYSDRVFREPSTRLAFNYAAADPKFEMRLGYSGDAGFDMAVTEDFAVDAHEWALVPCGLQLELPEGTFGWIVARSSTMKNWGFMVLPGVIDTGFRGELFASVYNTRGYSQRVEAGDRIAQIVPLPNLASQMEPIRVDSVNPQSARGAAGFGSTGKQ